MNEIKITPVVIGMTDPSGKEYAKILREKDLQENVIKEVVIPPILPYLDQIREAIKGNPDIKAFQGIDPETMGDILLVKVNGSWYHKVPIKGVNGPRPSKFISALMIMSGVNIYNLYRDLVKENLSSPVDLREVERIMLKQSALSRSSREDILFMFKRRFRKIGSI